MAGAIGDVTSSKRGLQPSSGANILSKVVVQTSGELAEFTFTIESGEDATIMFDVSSTSTGACSLVLKVMNWSTDFVSEALCIGNSQVVNFISYLIEGNTFKVYIGPRGSYSPVKAKFLSWTGYIEVSSSIVSEKPTGAVDVSIKSVSSF